MPINKPPIVFYYKNEDNALAISISTETPTGPVLEPGLVQLCGPGSVGCKGKHKAAFLGYQLNIGVAFFDVFMNKAQALDLLVAIEGFMSEDMESSETDPAEQYYIRIERELSKDTVTLKITSTMLRKLETDISMQYLRQDIEAYEDPPVIPVVARERPSTPAFTPILEITKG